MGYLRDWEGYNEALVKRGLILLDLDFVAGWSRELKAMNDGKEGGRYRYPESFVKLLAVVHAYVLPYRQLEGFMRGLSQHVDGLKAPDYTTIWWRVSKMKVDLAPSVAMDKDVTIAVDATGIKVSNRGEWIHKKWRVQRGFIKVHIAVDTRTKQILAIEVTKENVGDGRMLGRLVKGSAGVADVKRVIADGAYDSKSNFRMISDMDIEPLIRVRRNASLNNSPFRLFTPHSYCSSGVRMKSKPTASTVSFTASSSEGCFSAVNSFWWSSWMIEYGIRRA